MPRISSCTRVIAAVLVSLFYSTIVSDVRIVELKSTITITAKSSEKNHTDQYREIGTLDLLQWRDGNKQVNKGNVTPPVFARKPTIIIQLSGELGNQLGKLAFGYALKWILEDDYNIRSRIVLRHQIGGKWVQARKSMMCFLKMRAKDFSKGNTQEFHDRWNQQQTWLGGDRFVFNTPTSLRELDTFARIISNASNPPPVLPDDANITIPFIYSNSFDRREIVDRYLDRLKNLFKYDMTNPECCGPRVLPEETVFHARGFLAEIPNSGKSLGFEELSPNKTVTELLKNHQRGDKIAVLGRFASFAQLYVDRMQSEGLDARFVETNNGEQSFCFLMSARDEIVGSSKSSFIRWASFLGNASKARLYTLRSPERANGRGRSVFESSYKFTHPRLKSLFSDETYNSEEQDLIDQMSFTNATEVG